MAFQAKDLSFMDTDNLLPEELNEIVEILHGQSDHTSRKVEFPWDTCTNCVTIHIKDAAGAPESGDGLQAALLYKSEPVVANIQPDMLPAPNDTTNDPTVPPTSLLSQLAVNDNVSLPRDAPYQEPPKYDHTPEHFDFTAENRVFLPQPNDQLEYCERVDQSNRSFNDDAQTNFNPDANRRASFEQNDVSFGSYIPADMTTDLPAHDHYGGEPRDHTLPVTHYRDDVGPERDVYDNPNERRHSAFQSNDNVRAPVERGDMAHGYIQPHEPSNRMVVEANHDFNERNHNDANHDFNERNNFGGMPVYDTRLNQTPYDPNNLPCNFMDPGQREHFSPEDHRMDARNYICESDGLDLRSAHNSQHAGKPYERRNKKRRPKEYYLKVDEIIAQQEQVIPTSGSEMPPLPPFHPSMAHTPLAQHHMLSMQHRMHHMPFAMAPFPCMPPMAPFIPYGMQPHLLPILQGMPRGDPGMRHHAPFHHPAHFDPRHTVTLPMNHGDFVSPPELSPNRNCDINRVDMNRCEVDVNRGEVDRAENGARHGGDYPNDDGRHGDLDIAAYGNDKHSRLIDPVRQTGEYSNIVNSNDGVITCDMQIVDKPIVDRLVADGSFVERLFVDRPASEQFVDAPRPDERFIEPCPPHDQQPISSGDATTKDSKCMQYSDLNSNIHYGADCEGGYTHGARRPNPEDATDEVYHDAVQSLDKSRLTAAVAHNDTERPVVVAEAKADSHYKLDEAQKHDIQFIYEPIPGEEIVESGTTNVSSHDTVSDVIQSPAIDERVRHHHAVSKAPTDGEVVVSKPAEKDGGKECAVDVKPELRSESKRNSVSSGENYADALSSPSESVVEVDRPLEPAVVIAVKQEVATTQKKSWADLVKANGGAATVITPTVQPATVAATPHTPQSVVDSTVTVTAPVTVMSDAHITDLGRQIKNMSVQYSPVVALTPRGLVNNSNWCYVNATLQALLACTPLYYFLTHLGRYPALRRVSSSTPILDALSRFFCEFSAMPKAERVPSRKGSYKPLSVNTGASFSPKYIYSMLQALEGSSSFKSGKQEDAEEFLGLLLNGLHEEMTSALHSCNEKNKGGETTTNGFAEDGCDMYGGDDADDVWERVGPKNRGTVTRQANLTKSPISEIFSGELRSSVSKSGQKDTAIMEPFFTLQLDIQSDKVTSVNDALDRLVSKESVINSKSEEVYKRMTLDQLPPILILHLKFFQYNKNGGCQKSNKKISYSHFLEINKDVLSPKSKIPFNQRRYELFAVVYHMGKTLAGGHYTADIFHTGTGGWMRYDDESIVPVSIPAVFCCMFPRVPYLLYYKRTGLVT